MSDCSIQWEEAARARRILSSNDNPPVSTGTSSSSPTGWGSVTFIFIPVLLFFSVFDLSFFVSIFVLFFFVVFLSDDFFLDVDFFGRVCVDFVCVDFVDLVDRVDRVDRVDLVDLDVFDFFNALLSRFFVSLYFFY
eukprot:UN28820